MDSLSKTIGIPIFSGSGDIKDFIKAFQLQSLCFNWDEAKQCTAIPFLLTGKAENIYETISTDNKKKIEEVLKALSAGCVVSQEVLLDRFFERKPNGQELLSAYALALQVLLKKAMPTLQAKEAEILLRRQIGQYLPEHMRALIHFNSQKTWEELITAIDQSLPHTKAVDISESYSGGACRSDTGNIAVKVEPVDINAISTDKPSFQGICHYCKTPGHRISDCDKAKVKNRARESEARAGGAKTGSSRFDSSKQFSSNDSAYRSNKPRDYANKSQSNYSGNRRSNESRSVNNIELDDDEAEDDEWCQNSRY